MGAIYGEVHPAPSPATARRALEVLAHRGAPEHASGRRLWDRALWMLLNFELWHRVYIDREGL